jgi:hypothetical protein
MADGRIFVGIGRQRWEAASQQEEQANCPSAGGKLPCLHLLSRSNAQVQGAGKLATSMTCTATLRVEKGGNKKANQKLEKDRTESNKMRRPVPDHRRQEIDKLLAGVASTKSKDQVRAFR